MASAMPLKVAPKALPCSILRDAAALRAALAGSNLSRFAGV
jgi:hypothetical protein